MIVVDVGARVIRRDGTDIPLAPKVFDLLLVLATNRPNAVGHNRLHAALWPGIHVSETSLAALVTQLRRALGDDRLIRTLHRVGYAFVGDAVIQGDQTTTPVWRLIWRRRHFEMRAGESLIGRGRGCAAQIDAESVSRHHARLTMTGDSVSIEDLDSKNGTYVAGQPVTTPRRLDDGEQIRLGSVVVKFRIPGFSPATETES